MSSMFYLCWHVEGEDEGEGEEEGVGEDEHGGVHLKPLPLLKLTATRTGATPDTAALPQEAERAAGTREPLSLIHI